MLEETECSDADPVENYNSNNSDSNYSTQKVKLTHTSNRLSWNTELPLDESEPTNQRSGRRQRNGFK